MIGSKLRRIYNSGLLSWHSALGWLFKICQRIFRVKRLAVSILVIVCLTGNFWAFRLWQARLRSPTPQAILILGGSPPRIQFAMGLAQRHPKLKIIISDYPIIYRLAQSILKDAQIDQSRVVYDFCATDTVTNFTCTLKFLEDNHLSHLYLVTSDYHMTRAMVVGTVVFGSHGIVLTPVKVPTFDNYCESKIRIIRDGLRSVFWLFTHQTGAELNPRNYKIKLRQDQSRNLL